MESIVIFALIAIASSVFQSIAQNNKKQKQNTKMPQPNKPNLQPRTMSQPSKPNLQPRTVPKPIYKTKPAAGVSELVDISDEGVGEAVSFRGSMSDASLEGIQTEAMTSRPKDEQQKIVVIDEAHQIITFDDLQKSVVMAEILGKPRSLKRSIR